MRRDAFSVVIPAYQAASTLQACLEAINAARPAPDEVIVYDDGSTDQTPEIARAHGARVIAGTVARRGPAYGRNRGAQAARCPTVLFVDADVAVAPDALGRLSRLVSSDENVSAAFGAYGDRVSAVVRNVAGRYANLRHHHTHVTAAPSGVAEAQTFWSGLGAVDRAAFLAVGGFDEGYGRPCIEDVELGLRLKARGGRLLLVPDARGDHMKDWTLVQLWRTDLLQRAVPWSQLVAEGRIAPTLNTGGAEQTKSVLAHLVWLFALVAMGTALVGESAIWLAFVALSAGALLAYLVSNRRFLRVLRRQSRGTAIAGAGLHWLYHCYASLTFAIVVVWTGFMTRMRTRRSHKRALAARLRTPSA
ncbi:glycosyltransferase family 2 protein [Parvularcula dongshanensis]|uniref:GT2 family glycosyltransferase n=1 Tax=Parvularcula dongshanensis TaxID=1173995 RepID=A0A840I5F9_9PROT|nr:glycosyltransferase [Parvularcula dongshanensis]MBB4659398.1 GT2 family glycosyltransferase [Parvularcula dongshanensis]